MLALQIKNLSNPTLKVFSKIKKVMRKKDFTFSTLFIDPFKRKGVLKDRFISNKQLRKVLYSKQYLEVKKSNKLEDFIEEIGGKYKEISLDLLAKILEIDLNRTELGNRKQQLNDSDSDGYDER